MINLLWIVPIITLNRIIGMGIYQRLYYMPVACAAIGTCITMAIGREWWWLFIFGLLFFVGRTPTPATGLSLATDNPHLQPDRDAFYTRWCTWVAVRLAAKPVSQVFIWSFLRIAVFYAPLFLAVSPLWGIASAIAYGICWPLCYRYLGIARAEWGTCVCLAVILAAFVV